MAHKYKQLSLDWVKKNFPRIPETKDLLDEIGDFDEFVERAAAAISKGAVDDKIMGENAKKSKALEPVIKKLRTTKWTDAKTKNIPALVEEMSNTHKVFVRELTGAFDSGAKTNDSIVSKLLTQQATFMKEIDTASKVSVVMTTRLDTIEQSIKDVKTLQGTVFKDDDWMTRWRSLKNEFEKSSQGMNDQQKNALKKPFNDLAAAIAKQVQLSQDLKKRVAKELPK